MKTQPHQKTAQGDALGCAFGVVLDSPQVCGPKPFWWMGPTQHLWLKTKKTCAARAQEEHLMLYFILLLPLRVLPSCLPLASLAFIFSRVAAAAVLKSSRP